MDLKALVPLLVLIVLCITMLRCNFLIELLNFY